MPERSASLPNLFPPWGIEVLGLSDFYRNWREIEGSGNTFAEKRPDKAAAVAKQIAWWRRLLTIRACALTRCKGRPGVKKRVLPTILAALPGESRDQRNIRKLLDLMKGKTGDRKAHF